jgi:hypothetical protein
MRASVKRRVAERAGDCCEYCRSPQAFSPDPFSVEHIIPRFGGGTDALGNLALSCQGCNNHKHTRIEAPDPHDGAPAPLFHPRRQRWAEHFAWTADFTRLEGRTPTGRATIEALRLNRVGLINLRAVLRVTDHHPRTIPADDA